MQSRNDLTKKCYGMTDLVLLKYFPNVLSSTVKDLL